MRAISKKPLLISSGTTDFLQRRVRESVGILLIIIGVLSFLMLLTYDRSDPSLNTAVGGEATNLLGAPGALVSDLLFQLFGVASFILPLFWCRLGWKIVRHVPLPHRGKMVVFGPLVLLCLSSFLTLFPPLLSWSFCDSLGGISGFLLVRTLAFLIKIPPYLAAISYGLILAFLGLIFFKPWQKLSLDRPSWSGLLRFFTSLQAKIRLRKSSPSPSSTEEETIPLMREEPTLTTSLSVEPMVEAPSSLDPLKEKSKPKKNKPLPLFGDTDDTLGSTHVMSERTLLPPLSLLQMPPRQDGLPVVDETTLHEQAQMLESVLEEFGIKGKIIKVRPGPVVTLYELEPSAGTKSSRVISLADDIARSMCAVSARVAIIPGRNAIGIELPNEKRTTVYLRELLTSESYEKSAATLALALGKDIGGTPIVADLAKMPHLLLAGTTGSGKSVAVNTMILSLLYRMPPERCKFIMIDPKMLELSVYDDIPHLLSPVVTDPRKAVVALKWAVREMENRYRAMSSVGVRNIEGYNQRLREARDQGLTLSRKVQTGFDPHSGKPIFESQPLDLTELPYIVVVVDEMADLMLVAGKEIEAAVQRLAQMARAAGIHLIMATQRPSVDVITGTIKANFPSRISFQVTSKIDSRTILGEQGAEQLLGQGDMLYMASAGRTIRVHGPFVSDREVEEVVKSLKERGAPSYIEDITEDTSGESNDGEDSKTQEHDPLFDQAVALICREGKASTSFIQRHFQIGYNRAARIMDQMEAEGIVGAANSVGRREIFARSQQE